jgi:hypothetical protein
MTAKLWSVARPLEGAHSSAAAKQPTQRGRTGTPMYAVGDWNIPQAPQRSNINWPRRAPAKNGWLAASATGTGLAGVASVLTRRAG